MSVIDEDIQYIGSRPAQSLSKDLHFQLSQIVTGITLHVEKSGDEPACVLTFQRSKTSAVNIGRRPSNEERTEMDDGSAMFRCAVVSRKHAKIAFTDSGFAYLIDMDSHHGTHIRKPGENLSRVIMPETPTKIADGDVLTFGKSVGRHNDIVQPVVARVELIYTSRSESVIEPPTPEKPSIQVDLTRPTPRPNSGRYGIFSPTSDKVSFTMSDQDSDVEEIPAPGSKTLPLRVRRSCSPSSESNLDPALEILNNLPPVHIPSTNGAQVRSPDILPPPWRSSTSFFDTSLPIDSRRGPVSPIVDPRSPKSSDRSSLSPSLAPPFSISDGPDSDGNAHPTNNELGFSEDYHTPERSRFTSPMELASPSSSREQCVQEEPSVVGAWPDSPLPSSSLLSSPAPVITENSEEERRLVEQPHPPTLQKTISIGSICSGSLGHVRESLGNSDGGLVETIPKSLADEVHKHNKVEGEIVQLQADVAELQDQIAKLQARGRKSKNHFNTNVQVISEKLFNMDERLSDANTQYATLVTRLIDTADIEIPELKAQINVLKEQSETYHEYKDIKDNILTLRELVSEVHKLREDTTKQTSAQLEAIRAARDASLAKIAEDTEAQTPANTPPSLKRKHSNDEMSVGCHPWGSRLERDIGFGSVPTVDSVSHFNIHSMPNTVCYLPPSKRVKRAAAFAMQTVTAVTVGAIATWSALAFS